MRTTRLEKPAYHPHLFRLTPYVLVVAAVSFALFAGLMSGLPAVAAAAGPKVYVGLFGDNAVAVIDSGTQSVVGRIPVPTGPHGMVVTPDGRRVYVSSDGASTVTVIDTATDQAVGSVEVGRAPHGLAITPDGRQVLAMVFEGNQAAWIDTATNQVTGQVAVPNPHNVAISPDGRTAYVASQPQGTNALVILDVATKTQTGRVPLERTPRALNFSPDGQWLYFTLAGVDALQVLDPTTNQIVAQIPVGASPHVPLFTPDGQYALVVSQGPGELDIVTTAGRAVSGAVPVGEFPHWVATDSDGDTAYVTNENANTVSVVDLDAKRVTATIPVGTAPRKIVVQPEASYGSNASQPSSASRSAQPAVASPPAPAAQATGAQSGAAVRIAGFSFNEATITVAQGQTITWTNGDSVPHTTTSADGVWDSGRLNPGASFSVTLDRPGAYAYACQIHPFMRGTVTVAP